MRTVIIIVAGLALLAVMLRVGKPARGNWAEAARLAARNFVPLWVLLAAGKLWIEPDRRIERALAGTSE